MSRSRPSGLPPFTLVTGNASKLREAERILGFRPATHDVDLPEIQSLDIERILEQKAEEAWKRLASPLVVEETGLYLDALGGFPGPLVRWMLEAVGPAGLARLVHAVGDPRATARCLLRYRDAERSLVAEGRVAGELVAAPQGEGGFGWDVVFRPLGETRTFAEMPQAEKDLRGHRGRAWQALAAAFARTPEAGPGGVHSHSDCVKPS